LETMRNTNKCESTDLGIFAFHQCYCGTYSPVLATFSITMATFRAAAVEYRSYDGQKEGWIWTVLGSAELGKGGEFCEELKGK
jgi:hypothetical protein